MTYEIRIGKGIKDSVEVNIEAPNPTGIPLHVLVGVGLKRAKYKAFLNKCLTGNQGKSNTDNEKLLQFLAFIHKTGKEKGSISLYCRCKSKERFHAECIKEFLEENRETLDMLLPYMFPDAGYKAVEQPMFTSNKGIESLSEDDKHQIMALIEQDKQSTSDVEVR